jgi:hypothetical protein
MNSFTFKVVLGVAVVALLMAHFLGYAPGASADTIGWCRNC